MPAKTVLNRPEAMANYPPPRGLHSKAQQLWKDALLARPGALWTPVDLHFLRMYVEAVSDVERLTAEIRETAEVVDGRINPLVPYRGMRESAALAFASRLRLLPSNRMTAKDAGRYAAHGAKAARTQAALDDDTEGLLQ